MGVIAMNAIAEESSTTVRQATSEEQKKLQEIMQVTDLPELDLERMKKYSNTTVNHFVSNGVADFNYSEKSVKFMSEIIDTEGQKYPAKNKEKLTYYWGAYYAEALIKSYGGKWVQTKDEQYIVKLDNGMYVFPFTRIDKHFHLGHEYAIYAQYSSIMMQKSLN